jgi:hypothetical protein
VESSRGRRAALTSRTREPSVALAAPSLAAGLCLIKQAEVHATGVPFRKARRFSPGRGSHPAAKNS